MIANLAGAALGSAPAESARAIREPAGVLRSRVRQRARRAGLVVPTRTVAVRLTGRRPGRPGPSAAAGGALSLGTPPQTSWHRGRSLRSSPPAPAAIRTGGRAAYRTWFRGRRADDQEILEAQLPLTADLLAACLGSSCAPSAAAEAVSRAVGAPMRPLLAAVAAQLRMGADPAECWGRFAALSPALAPLGRCLARADLTGAPPVAALARLAEERRARVAAAALLRTRRVGVLATAPLGLCFLPAFVLVGVVPVVIGLASAFLGRM